MLRFVASYRDEANRGKLVPIVASTSYSTVSFLDEEMYVIAMHLDLFVRHCFPKWSSVFTIASKIMTDLSTNDSEFYDHLKTISKIRTKINTKVTVVAREMRCHRFRLGFRLRDHLAREQTERLGDTVLT